MKAFKKIELKWVNGFYNSNLVKDNLLNIDLAKALGLPIKLSNR